MLTTQTNPKSISKILLIAVVIAVCGATAGASAAQSNVKAVDDMYTCIENNTKKANTKTTVAAQQKFRTELRKKTVEAAKDRKQHLRDKKFSDATLEAKYQKIYAIKASDSQARDMANPTYHLGKIKAERDNLLAQLSRNEQVAHDVNTPTDKLIANRCETTWGLRALAAAGRKWQGQIDNDTLSARNTVAKAHWIAANKPAGKDPSQFDSQIAQLQSKLDGLVIPANGVVGTGTLNPKDGDIKKAFENQLYQPQKQLHKKILANTKQLKKLAAPKVIKPTNKRNGYVQLPVNNSAYYIYGSEKANTGDGGNTPPNQRFGKPALVMMFQNVAIKFHKQYPEMKLVAGDLNAAVGHSSHKNGVDIDVYGQNHMAADMRGNYRTSKSVERTIALGKLFMDTKKIDIIIYNDPVVIKQVNAYAQRNNLPGRMVSDNPTHEFHFHVRIK